VTILLTNAKLIDGTGNVFENAWVMVREERIEDVGDGHFLNNYQNYMVIDCARKTVLPGLIDCHVHISTSGDDPQKEAKLKKKEMRILQAVNSCKETLFSGITTFRDQGSFECIDICLREAIENRFIIGPRIVCSGRAICTTGGHGWTLGAREADGIDEIRKAVREQLKAGADNIKIMASGGVATEGVEPIHVQFSLDELRTAVEEARKAGKTISAHSHPAQSIKDCINAGINSIQHGIYADDEAIEMMVERKSYLTPTLMAPRQAFENPDKAPEWLVKKVRAVVPVHHQSAAKAYRAGVKIAMGSDAGAPMVFHGKNLRELREFVEIGMTPHEAILSATKNAAELLGLQDSIGSIQKGKIADIVIIEGNPLENISVLEEESNVIMVIKKGKIFKDMRNNQLKV
jgi:imidazolonepropionase-like amidohydrolase